MSAITKEVRDLSCPALAGSRPVASVPSRCGIPGGGKSSNSARQPCAGCGARGLPCSGSPR